MFDCFISYSRKDGSVVDTIRLTLESKGYTCWIDRENSIAGLDYASSIVKGIRESKIFIFILSANSIRSRHVLNELNSAVNADKIIMPIRIDDAPISYGIEYYLGKTQWLMFQNNSKAQLNNLIDCIKTLLEQKNEEEVQNIVIPTKELDKSRCRMMRYQDLLKIGYTSKSIAIKLVENDYINCNGIQEDNEGTPDQWEMYLRDESDSYRYLINENDEIVGDWSFASINDNAFARAMSGDFLENELDIYNTKKVCLPGIYNGYLLTCQMLPDYRTYKNNMLLIYSFVEQLVDYAENDIFFKGWVMNVFSSDVESLVMSLGFKYLTNNKSFGKIYYCDFVPLPKSQLFKNYATLVNKYSEIENEEVVIRKAIKYDSITEIEKCIYNTDAHIYPSICEENEEWKEYIRCCFSEENNFFSKDNIVVARLAGRIVGIVCILKTKKEYSCICAKDLNLQKKDGFIKVKKEYFDLINEDNKAFDGYNILNVSVLPEYQNKGIGSKLMQYCIDVYGKENIFLDVISDNKKAIKLYERYGFIKINEYDGYAITGKIKCNRLVRNKNL